MKQYTINNEWVSLKEIDVILESHAQIFLGETAKKAIVDCRNYLDEKLARHDKLVYGINTGFGSLCNTAIEKEDILLSTFFIVAGTLIKIYSVVGLLFFLFTPHKKKFIYTGIVWIAVLVCLPMLISSPQYIIDSYIDWYEVLIEKNGQNIESSMFAGMQDISVMGMIRRIFGYFTMPNIYVTLPAGILMLLPIFRFQLWSDLSYRLHYLALLLIGLVIFSSSAESPTFVIAVVGYLIWHIQQPSKDTLPYKILLVLMLLLTIFSPTDLFPRFIREQYIVRYSLKALPCFVAWLAVVYTLLFSQFKNKLA